MRNSETLDGIHDIAMVDLGAVRETILYKVHFFSRHPFSIFRSHISVVVKPSLMHNASIRPIACTISLLSFVHLSRAPTHRVPVPVSANIGFRNDPAQTTLDIITPLEPSGFKKSLGQVGTRIDIYLHL